MKYAVIEKGQVWIPGDERSRTNPGHGYPEHYETTITLHEFNTKDDLISFLKFRSSKNFRVIQFEDLEMTTEIDVKIKLETK